MVLEVFAFRLDEMALRFEDLLHSLCKAEAVRVFETQAHVLRAWDMRSRCGSTVRVNRAVVTRTALGAHARFEQARCFVGAKS